MKKIFLATMLVLISIQGRLYAQSARYKSEMLRMSDKTYATFNMNKMAIAHRHTAFFEKDDKLIIEMSNLSDYDVLSDINALLKNFLANLDFYKDSLESLGSDNIRIDYQVSVPGSNAKFRFKRYSSDGDLYTKTKNDLSRLKIAQDTIRIKINKTVEQTYSKKFSTSTPQYRSVMLTFLLNDYTDVNKLIDEKEMLQHAVDTMAAAAQPKKKAGWSYQTTIFYHPYIKSGKNLWKYDYITDLIYGMETILPAYNQHKAIAPNLNIGASLLRNKIAPIADIGLEHHHYWKKDENDYRLIGLFTEPYFLFNQGADGKFHTYVNWFLNAEIGENHPDNHDGIITWSETTTMGIGYLLNPDGIYSSGTTMKAFLNITIKSGITISPEVISTNNFKTIYPSLSVKILDIR